MFQTARALRNAAIRGADAEFMRAVITDKIAFIDRTIAAVDAALAGDARFLIQEPDDTKLQQMKEYLVNRRAEFEAAVPANDV